MKKTLFSALLFVAASSLGLNAETRSFDFADPKGVNNIQFHLDAPLESISGLTKGITGRVSFDPANPAATTGSLHVDVSTLQTANDLMTKHMLGDSWLDAATYPDITFNLVELRDVETEGNITNALAAGEMTIKGVTREITAPITLTYLQGKLSVRNREREGDLLILRTRFTIERSDFNINAGQNEDKVSDTIELSTSLAGQSPY